MKKLVSILLAILMTLTAAIPVFAEEPPAVSTLGDVDGDGSIKASEARQILRFSAKLEKTL